jgi:predicted nucleic acid-binding protein
MSDSRRIRSLTTNGEVLRSIYADAGPFIALFNRDDRDHDEALRGFRQLHEGRVRVIAPLPVVFEVYKWLRHKVSANAARSALVEMGRSTQIVYPDANDLARAAGTVELMPSWNGSLEDALLARTVLAMRIPLWTLNYRDFAAFRDLPFWNPR